MYYGIQVVSQPLHKWGIEELREFIGRNGEYLVGLKDTKPECIDFSELEMIGRDFEMVAGKLDELCRNHELEAKVSELEGESEDLWRQVDGLEDEVAGLENTISELEDEIAELEEQLANREE